MMDKRYERAEHALKAYPDSKHDRYHAQIDAIADMLHLIAKDGTGVVSALTALELAKDHFETEHEEEV